MEYTVKIRISGKFCLVNKAESKVIELNSITKYGNNDFRTGEIIRQDDYHKIEMSGKLQARIEDKIKSILTSEELYMSFLEKRIEKLKNIAKRSWADYDHEKLESNVNYADKVYRNSLTKFIRDNY